MHMKKESASLFGNIFGAKGKAPAPTTEVRITSYSQPHVLRQRMQEEQLTHGETVTANISPVRLDRMYSEEPVLYFCPMKKLEVLNVVASGDGGSLPVEAALEGFSVPKDLAPGLYKLCNVTLTSNGKMQVKATSETTWEKIEK
jgi:hypothetical protein